eukprot:TRINITY_DN28461_c0_g1_i1.p1 TRINITY_DN28461_c0_g1~~TRINITY_DN28461_c0_g1_i1.p1  ORF type:complete len:693 (+),score=104.48 TRINITY_DN28461_c0_g1_i1:35-2113(+)
MHPERNLFVSLAVLCLVKEAAAAGDIKLWQLGDDVNDNPITVFTMFLFVVLLSVAIEMLKHKIEHETKDKHRRLALGAIYSELMMVGIVSFLLILAAECGLTDVKIRKPGCDDPEPVVSNSTSNSSDTGSSSSGSNPCEVTFNLAMFEYAHLVLFIMGLAYGTFIQVCFIQRDRFCKQLEQIQEKTLEDTCTNGDYKTPSTFGIMGVLGRTKGWDRCVLALRSTIILHQSKRLREVCDPRELKMEELLATLKGIDLPQQRAPPREAERYFDIAKYSKIATSEVLVELLHVPIFVWIAIVFMSASNLIHLGGMSLSSVTLIFAFIGPVLSIWLLWRISSQLQTLISSAIGHPDILKNPFYAANKMSDVSKLNIASSRRAYGLEWAAGEKTPWDILTGCCEDDHPLNSLDLNDPDKLERQIQIIVFASCFYIGQISMLVSLIYEEMGIVVVFGCILLPVIALIAFVPRSLFIYTLVHRSAESQREWLINAVEIGHKKKPTSETKLEDELRILAQMNNGLSDSNGGYSSNPLKSPYEREVSLMEGGSEGSASKYRAASPASQHTGRYPTPPRRKKRAETIMHHDDVDLDEYDREFSYQVSPRSTSRYNGYSGNGSVYSTGGTGARRPPRSRYNATRRSSSSAGYPVVSVNGRGNRMNTSLSSYFHLEEVDDNESQFSGGHSVPAPRVLHPESGSH